VNRKRLILRVVQYLNSHQIEIVRARMTRCLLNFVTHAAVRAAAASHLSLAEGCLLPSSTLIRHANTSAFSHQLSLRKIFGRLIFASSAWRGLFFLKFYQLDAQRTRLFKLITRVDFIAAGKSGLGRIKVF
jgi:hypothetical protein